MNPILISLITTILPKLLCRFFGMCIDIDECDDGLCEEALKSLKSLEEVGEPRPMLTSASDIKALGLPSFDFCFECFPELVEATKNFVTALLKFLGRNHDHPVG